MTAVISSEKIPNNVHLSDDKRLQRALESWQPNFINWWKDMGPEGFQEKQIYLRTAISVDVDGWAIFDHVKMPDYRWGIFLADAEPDRKIPIGDHFGQPVERQVQPPRPGILAHIAGDVGQLHRKAKVAGP